MRIARLIALVSVLISSDVAFGQTQGTASRTDGKPQVTTLQHQTLGESWEAFMRISGTQMCASHEPQYAQRCEAIKKVHLTGQGEIVFDSGSLRTTLVFSERKLAEVLIKGNGDWDMSLAEFTQKYGIPDTRTADSAAWTFGDGGGITASVLPGNIVTAAFYSREGKPQEPQTPGQTSLAPQALPSDHQDVAEASRRARASQRKPKS